jgi:hypothetical protein
MMYAVDNSCSPGKPAGLISPAAARLQISPAIAGYEQSEMAWSAYGCSRAPDGGGEEE